jgi:hypothetical protein
MANLILFNSNSNSNFVQFGAIKLNILANLKISGFFETPSKLIFFQKKTTPRQHLRIVFGILMMSG